MDGSIGRLEMAATIAREAWKELGERRPMARKLVFAAAMAACACVAAFATASLMESRRYADWISAPGVILLSDIRACGDGKFAAAVRYRYDIAGSVNVSDRITGDDPECGSREFAQRAAGKWQVDQRVPVRYDASAAGKPLLVAGSSPVAAGCALAFSLLAFACAAYGALAPILSKRSANPTR